MPACIQLKHVSGNHDSQCINTKRQKEHYQRTHRHQTSKSSHGPHFPASSLSSCSVLQEVAMDETIKTTTQVNKCKSDYPNESRHRSNLLFPGVKKRKQGLQEYHKTSGENISTENTRKPTNIRKERIFMSINVSKKVR